MSITSTVTAFAPKHMEQTENTSISAYGNIECLPWEGVYIWANEDQVAN